MRVNSLISSARLWLTCALAASGAGMAQAGDVYWSVDIDVPIERHGRVGTVVSNVPGGVVRGGQTVVVTPAPVVIKTVEPRVHHPRKVIVVPVRHAYGKPAWAGHRHRHVVHHHVHRGDWQARQERRHDRRDERREYRRDRDWR